MAPLPRIQRLLLRIDRAPSSIRPSHTRSLSTTASRCAASPSKPPAGPRRAGTASRSREAQSKPSRTGRPSPPSPTIRITPSTPKVSRPAPSPASPVAPGPTKEAITAAEQREASLRVARLRRADKRQEEALEEAKKKLAKKEYQKRYNTAARKWVSSIIALPILLVTSYYLFDRLALGNEQKTLPKKKEEENE
ncbi:hypothetical protein G7Z17_g3260 [Cylindrodendrum hubeiense]|uniref:Uncharacterized protein n=1 Tax=Cylindrodendrum hubeiense TaxID=595255 RepID=A0A9P5HLG9_9HYPO|nr:hypothetical protein G7Z17_g3260 [Cylindrodendrum hubeiense]